MEEQPTVQMGGSSEQPDSDAEDIKTPPTVPFDDAMSKQGWPPQRMPAHAPPPAFSQQPMAPSLPGASAGATRMMGPAPGEPLLAWLAVVDGPGAPRGQVFALQPETIVGRTAGQIVLSGDPYVSAQHAKLRHEPSEDDPDSRVIVLYDMASANGTFAGSKDGYRDQQVYRHELHDGDHLLIGETTLVFKEV